MTRTELTDVCMKGAEGLAATVGDLVQSVEQMRMALSKNMTTIHHSSKHDDHEYHWSVRSVTTPWYHIIIDMFNLLGVAIMVLSAIGTLPMLINHIIPSMIFHKGADKKATSYVLRARMQLGRGIMLGMDFMVTSDVIETLCGEIDIIKLICIVVVRSWLGYERSKEVEHMSHELDHWNKAQKQLLNTIGTDLDDPHLSDRIKEVFFEFDSNKSGDITSDELHDALGKMGVSVTQKEALKMVESTGEGGMTLAQFDKVIREMLILSNDA